jgi:hypothetical protein
MNPKIKDLIINKKYDILADSYINYEIMSLELYMVLCELDDINSFLILEKIINDKGGVFVEETYFRGIAFYHKSKNILDHWANMKDYDFRLDRYTMENIVKFNDVWALDYILTLPNINKDDLLKVMKDIYEEPNHDNSDFEKICEYFRNRVSQ